MKDNLDTQKESTRRGRPRRRPKVSDRPPAEEILFQAGQLFIQKGYEPTSTREIAAAAGLEQKSIYYYFPTKEDILVALADQLVGHSQASFEALMRAKARPASKFYRAIRDRISFRLAQPFDITPALMPVLSQAPDGRGQRFTALFEELNTFSRTLRTLYQQAVAAEEFANFDESLAFAAVLGVINWPSISARREGSPGTEALAGLDTENLELIPQIRRDESGSNGFTPHEAADQLARLAVRALLRDPTDLDDIVTEAMSLEPPADGH